MAVEKSAFYERMAERGVTRRDFLNFCGGLAVLMGLSKTMVPQIALAVEKAASGQHPTVWMTGGSCTGCSESVVQSVDPGIAEIVLEILSMNYHETVMMAMGHDADRALFETADAHEGEFFLLYEGSVMEGWDGKALTIAGMTSTEQLEIVAPKAAAVVSVGSCAVDGGWVKANPNPAQATGVSEYLKRKGIQTPVINLPSCPTNAEHVVAIIVDVLLLGTLENGKILDKLDEYGRPKYFFNQTIHDNCPRRGHFENGEFVYEFGTEEEAKGYCLYPLGCKGPQTYNSCPVTRWNGKTSWCVEAGAPCIGCSSFNWFDENAPLLGRFRRVGISAENPAGLNATMLPVAATGVVAGALAVHGFGMYKAGRVGSGAPTEEMKDYDKKRQAKKEGE